MSDKGIVCLDVAVLFTTLCCLPAMQGSKIGSGGVESSMMMPATSSFEIRC